MTVSRHALRVAAGALAFVFAGAAGAQENLDQGKTPAQLYASDCAICHKSPQGLSKAGGLFGLQSFLREHYTASREAAGAIAAYLEAVDRTAPPSARGGKRSAKGKPDAKPRKPAEAKTEPKATEPKAAEPKAAEPKSTEPKSAETKSAEPKSEPKTSEPKSEPKASEAKASAPAPAAKSDKPDKSE